jgi:hypothetical protein
MRNFQLLDGCRADPESDSLELFFMAASSEQPKVALHREGSYVTISASYGPFEIALRPRYEDLVRTLSRLTAVDGLLTTRQVGTGQAYLAIGLSPDNSLLLRPTIVADATGHFCLNIEITAEMRQALFDWLKVPVTSNSH